MTDERRIAELQGKKIEITIRCACTKISIMSPEWLVIRCGAQVTVEEAERRLICKTCRERGRLAFDLTWAARFHVDRGTPLPIVPAWVRPLLGRRR